MTARIQSTFPANALDWLVGAKGGHVLALGRTCAPLMATLDERGDILTAADPDPSGVRRLLAHAPRALPTVSEASALPFVPCAFDVVLINQSFHTLNAGAALPELARVLRPGGHLAIAYTIRDDSVPWVRRLVKLMRTVDPDAMAGDYGSAAVDHLAESPYFPEVERKDFRLWAPTTRDGLIDMVRRRFPRLEAERLNPLLTEVEALYESSARAPEPLLLPYRVACWRGYVDHTEFTSALNLPDDGLSISLSRHPLSDASRPG
ncbi:class I SAM-dependent methyltransferase [Propioniciclava tarda]|nr:class I SAM-dependent methyltransferase [Propioniciclava tarda]